MRVCVSISICKKVLTKFLSNEFDTRRARSGPKLVRTTSITKHPEVHNKYKDKSCKEASKAVSVNCSNSLIVDTDQCLGICLLIVHLSESRNLEIVEFKS